MRSALLAPSAGKSTGTIVVYVALPAMVFREVSHLKLATALWFPALAPWVLFVLVGGILFLLAPRLGWSREVAGALLLTAGLANTSFVGFPLLEALLGPSAIGPGVVADQLGSFMILTLVATYLGLRSHPNMDRVNSIKKETYWTLCAAAFHRLYRFPAFGALVVAFVLRNMPTDWSGRVLEVMLPVADRLAATLVPLSLLAVGMQFGIREQQTDPVSLTESTGSSSWLGRPIGILAAGLLIKLIVAPLVIVSVTLLFAGKLSFEVQVGLLEIAMAPMVTGSIVAIESGFDRRVASGMVFWGIPISLVTVPVWHYVLRQYMI